MNYSDTLDYMYSKLPMFHRIGAAAYRNNLDNINMLSRELNAPENAFKCIHIAGTNGKGSVSNMIAAVLQKAGYKTGLYTSPHLKDFRERIRVNGMMIGENEVSRFIQKHQAFFDSHQLSFFEMTVGMAFDFFRAENVEYAVIETGLGGRLDATNIIHPILSVITNISYDHTAILGDTLEKIAIEKAGIIKAETPVVIGETQTETYDIFKRKALENRSEISFADENIQAEIRNANHFSIVCDIFKNKKILFKNLEVDLPGLYQIKNIQTLIDSLEKLKTLGLHITDAHIVSALKQVRKITGFAGRWQVLSENPLVICDTAHNPSGLKYTLSQLKDLNFEKLHIVLGMVNDKDVHEILSLMPADASYYFCKPDIPRGLDVVELAEHAKKHNLHGIRCGSVPSALEQARKMAQKEDVIYAGGSTFVVAELV